jgi:hypothetical protein
MTRDTTDHEQPPDMMNASSVDAVGRLCEGHGTATPSVHRLRTAWLTAAPTRNAEVWACTATDELRQAATPRPLRITDCR